MKNFPTTIVLTGESAKRFQEEADKNYQEFLERSKNPNPIAIREYNEKMEWMRNILKKSGWYDKI